MVYEKDHPNFISDEREKKRRKTATLKDDDKFRFLRTLSKRKIRIAYETHLAQIEENHTEHACLLEICQSEEGAENGIHN